MSKYKNTEKALPQLHEIPQSLRSFGMTTHALKRGESSGGDTRTVAIGRQYRRRHFYPPQCPSFRTQRSEV